MNTITSGYERQGNGRNSKVRFTVNFDEKPSYEDVVKAQNKLGFNPGGYGGPQDICINENEIAEGLGVLFEAKWWCHGSCD